MLLNPNNTWTNTEATTSARRHLQRTLIQKSLDAIENVDFGLRENASLTVACSEALVPEIKEKLRAFRAELDGFIAQKSGHDQVYQFVFSFFPLTRKLESQ